MLKIYTYANCDTCRRATRWLHAHGREFSEHPIREVPPGRADLLLMLDAQKGDMRRLFNVAGRDYRAQKLAEKLPLMTQDEAVALLEANGNLVKRPFLLGPNDLGLVGFDEQVWAAALIPK